MERFCLLFLLGYAFFPKPDKLKNPEPLCIFKTQSRRSITALCWLPKIHMFIMGNSRGIIFAFELRTQIFRQTAGGFASSKSSNLHVPWSTTNSQSMTDIAGVISSNVTEVTEVTEVENESNASIASPADALRGQKVEKTPGEGSKPTPEPQERFQTIIVKPQQVCQDFQKY